MITLGLSSSTFRPSTEALPTVAPMATVAQALSQAATWCSLPEPSRNELRSVDIDPSSDFYSEQLGEMPIDAFLKAKQKGYNQALATLVERRSELLHSRNLQSPIGYEDAQLLGKLLVYLPMETVSDGAAEASSHRFFDVEDAPPWDTWFWYSKGAILSWVPESLISRAQAGIDANPVDCIHWTDWRDLSRLTT